MSDEDWVTTFRRAHPIRYRWEQFKLWLEYLFWRGESDE